MLCYMKYLYCNIVHRFEPGNNRYCSRSLGIYLQYKEDCAVGWNSHALKQINKMQWKWSTVGLSILAIRKFIFSWIMEAKINDSFFHMCRICCSSFSFATKTFHMENIWLKFHKIYLWYDLNFWQENESIKSSTQQTHV